MFYITAYTIQIILQPHAYASFRCRDNREVAFQQLQSALAGKDLELARLQQAQTEQAAELAEMRRVTKREGVNMDYLKNIVLQVS